MAVRVSASVDGCVGKAKRSGVVSLLARSAVCMAAMLSSDALPATEKTVKASSFGWNAGDATAALQAAFDSGARKVVIDRQAEDWITRPLFITNSNIEVVLADGVAVRAKKGEFRHRYDCLLKITGGASNVVVRGEGKAVLAMNKSDYMHPETGYPFSEWRHGIAIWSARDVTVRNLEILTSGGDGVYVNGPTGVTLEDLTVKGHNRQGISPISVTRMTVRRCSFSETVGTAPQCGIDMEPNKEKQHFVDVVYEDCVFNANRSHGICLYFGAFTARTTPVSVTFRRCRSQGNGNCGLSFMTGNPRNIVLHSQVKGTVRFEDCEFSGNSAEALKIMNHSTSGMDISFAGCVFDARGSRSGSAILFTNSQYPGDFGGLTFDRCSVLLDEGKTVCDFEAMRGIGIAGRLKGRLAVDRGGKKETFDLSAFAAKHVPRPELVVRFDTEQLDFRDVEAKGVMQPGKSVFTPYMRKPFVYVLAVPAAGEYKVRFKSYRVLKRGVEAVAAVVQLLDRSGTDLGRFDVPVGDFVYTLKANGPNVYRFETTLRDRIAVRVACDDAPGALHTVKPVHLYHGSGTRFRFCVPADAETVSVNITPQEPVEVELLNAAGKTVERMPYQRRRCIMQVKRPKSAADEVWTLRFVKIDEDMTFQVGGDVVPLVSVEPLPVLGVKQK